MGTAVQDRAWDTPGSAETNLPGPARTEPGGYQVKTASDFTGEVNAPAMNSRRFAVSE